MFLQQRLPSFLICLSVCLSFSLSLSLSLSISLFLSLSLSLSLSLTLPSCRLMHSSICSTLCRACSSRRSTLSQPRISSTSWSCTNSWPGKDCPEVSHTHTLTHVHTRAHTCTHTHAPTNTHLCSVKCHGVYPLRGKA